MISSDDPAALKVRRRLTGIGFLLVLSLLIWLSIAVYGKTFTSASIVTLHTSSVGNEMHPHADVKLHGVVVGEVSGISANGSEAVLKLAIRPDMVHLLPANVTAQMLPTTLFGERFVALIPPADPSPARLVAGSTISEDRSSNAIELQQVLNNMLPLLTAVQPQKLSATLTAVAQALQGRGTQLGQTLVQFDAYLAKTNPTLPQLTQDLTELVQFTRTYSQAAPDILQALTDFTTTTRTLVDQRANFETFYGSVTSSSQDFTTFLQQNSDNIIRLNADGRPSLDVLATYAPEFPCTLQMLNDFIPAMDKALGKGTNHHGLHVSVKVIPALGRYVPGRDKPVFNATGGPHCYSVPYRGIPVSNGNQTVPLGAAATAPAPAPAAQAGLGLPNSPGENKLINELVAPALGGGPQSLPDWSSVLVGPIYRGAEVTLK
ncbi:MAG TPA: MCE family protein [Streptosporangiaceae bacterium]|nr:MCE family protein [Streptosporangiaceae bacterium]